MKVFRFAILFLLLGSLMLAMACAEDDDNDSSSTKPVDDDATDDDATDDDVADDDVVDDDVADDDTTDDDTADDDTVDDDTTDDDTSEPQCDGIFLYSLTVGERNIPFPNNIFTHADSSSPTGIRVKYTGNQVNLVTDELLKPFKYLSRAMDKLNGFGMYAQHIIPVSIPPSNGMLPLGDDPSADDSIVLLVTDESSPHDGEFWPISGAWNYVDDAVEIQPVYSLPQHTTYTVAVLDHLQTGEAGAYCSDDHFAYMKLTEADTAHPQYELLEPFRQDMQPMFAALEEAGIEREHVLVAYQFTTQNITFELDSIREQLAEMAEENPPEWFDVTYTEQSPSSTIDVILEGKFMAPDWRDEQTGIFNHDSNGVPFTESENEIPFILALPKASEEYPQPFPVVIFQHGILSSKNEVKRAAEFYSRYGFAVIGIDLEYNGDRSSGNTIIDALSMVNLFDPLSMRDLQRQGVSEIIQLTHLIKNLDELDLVPYGAGGDEIADLDTSTIYYSSHSYGSILSGMMMAIIFDIDTFALNAPAADWLTIGLESPNSKPFFDIIDILESQLGFEIIDPMLTAYTFFRHVIDATDPVVMSQFFREQRSEDPRESLNVLQQFIAFDNTLSTPACAEFAFQFGFVQIGDAVAPVDGAQQVEAPWTGSGYYQYDSDDHTLIWRSESDPMVLGLHEQLGTYLRTRYDDGAPVVIDPLAE